MRRFIVTAAVLVLASVPRLAHAQALGPQRQFLAIEPYYEHASLDLGGAASKDQLHGFGARLWINLDPFHFILNSSIAVFASHAPSQSGHSTSMTTVGAEYDQYFLRRPLGGLVDPFLTLGGAATTIRSERTSAFGSVGSQRTYGTLIPGGGLRFALPNRFDLRGDVKDLILFNTPIGGAGSRTNNLLLQAGLGLTF